MKREPSVAGRFYYGDPGRLTSQVEQYILRDAPKEKAIGIMSPHAGLMYSGGVAGAVYSSIDIPRTFILIGPNHTGMGRSVSLMGSGSWSIPTGEFLIDEELAGKILKNTPLVADDAQAHKLEHSLEVQLPFIAYFSKDVNIVPISVMSASLRDCEEIGRAVAEAVKETRYDVVVSASSDMSHYVSDETARRLDNSAISEMLRLDPAALYSVVLKDRISMCGVLPATIMLYASIALGAKEARLLKYATSGEVSGDFAQVVGYAGVVVR
jgi:hypothetical protein